MMIPCLPMSTRADARLRDAGDDPTSHITRVSIFHSGQCYIVGVLKLGGVEFSDAERARIDAIVVGGLLLCGHPCEVVTR